MICSKIENGIITQSAVVGNHKGKPLVVNGMKLSSNTTLQDYLDAGWKQYVDPTPAESQVVTSDIVEDVSSYTYAVREKTVEEFADDIQGKIQLIDHTVRSIIDERVHWTAGPMVFDKAKSNMPKSKAIKEWTEALWLEYYARVALLEGGTPWSESMLDFSSIGDMPYTIKESMEEV